ncbi:primosomal protein DnaI [Gorillibacterium sp. sgz5001074]|uniref:primosomal protein DnaI n=1 Tax=Gorillibacterium sp. sgz5001074 TaxID=3446695 RepID=UPI003F672595
MDSMKDVLNSMPFASLRKKAEEKFHTILQDPLLEKWRSKFPEITDQDIMSHLNRVYQYTKEYRACRQCPGLDQCPNELPGHATRLMVDQVRGQNLIYDQKVPCPKQIARESDDAIQRRITSFYVDQSSLERGYDLKEIVRMDGERAAAVGRIVDYIDQTRQTGLQTKGLYLEGSLGTGKTFLMCYMLYELAKEGLSGVIVYMPDFAEDLKAMFGEPQKLKDTVDLLKETDLLVLDDIGAENMNPWLRDHVLGTILNYRMNRKPTFFTSNYEFEGLEKHFSFTSKDGEEEFKGQRIMDRIRHYVEVVEVHGHNKRSQPAQ